MDLDIQNLNELTDWMGRTPPQSRTGRDYPMKPEIRLRLPEKPGIYRMLRSNKDLLYIGKATSLKQRVNSYFRQKGAQAEHTLEMLSQAADLNVTLTGSALEAAVLESDLPGISRSALMNPIKSIAWDRFPQETQQMPRLPLVSGMRTFKIYPTMKFSSSDM
jgi:hypothetical protein